MAVPRPTALPRSASFGRCWTGSDSTRRGGRGHPGGSAGRERGGQDSGGLAVLAVLVALQAYLAARYRRMANPVGSGT